MTWNVPNILGLYYNPFVPTDQQSYLVQKAWNVEEKITTAYTKANIDKFDF